MKRRANGEGSVSKRKDGRWQARLTLTSGKRLSVYGRTRADVVKKLNAAKADLEKHVNFVHQNVLEPFEIVDGQEVQVGEYDNAEA